MICRILLAAALAFACHAQAQDYPAKPVRVIVPFVPGGGVDVVQRIVAEKLSAKWGQPVIVENRAGAAGNIGAEVVFRAPPDGYTLLSAPPGPLAINKHLYNTIGYDPDAFVPVSVLVLSPNMLLVSPKAGIQSVQELVALAKASPDRLNYSSQGSGSTSHLTAELFKSMAGVRITHIPYKGSAPADMAVISGEVALTFDNVGASLRYVRAGQLKALAVTSERRLASLPDVPAMAEVIPGFVSVTWYGLVAPPKTPMPIAEKLSAAIAEVLRLPDVRTRLGDLGVETVGNRPAEMAAFMRQESERWGAVIRAAGVKVD